MSKLDELKVKDYEETTALEDCILEVAKGKTWADRQTAKKAAEQLARQERVVEAIAALTKEAEEHRARYDVAAHDKETGTFKREYWAGRRDEAGHFRDRLDAALKEIEP